MTTTSLPPADSVDQLLLDLLFELSEKLRGIGLSNEAVKNDLLEKYNYFVKNSTSGKGRACTYSIKCKQLFYQFQYQEIKTLFDKVNQVIKMMDNGENII